MLTTMVSDLVLGRPPARRTLLQAPHYGLEIEVENGRNVKLPDTLRRGSQAWRSKPDGSLRNNGIELVSAPLPATKAPVQLRQALDCIRVGGGIATPRCGFHMHTNMLDHTVGNMLSYITLHMLLEPSMFAGFCPERRRSAFCVPITEYERAITWLAYTADWARGEHDMPSPIINLMNFNKYASLNMRTLFTFGTIENRLMRMSLDDDEMLAWVNALMRLNKVSLKYNDPMEVVVGYERNGLERLQQEVLGRSIEVDARDQDAAYMAAMLVSEGMPARQVARGAAAAALRRARAELVLDERGPVDPIVWEYEEEQEDIE